MDNVASQLGLGKATVLARTKRLRKAGVKLPFKRANKGYDVPGLNNLIKEYKKNG